MTPISADEISSRPGVRVGAVCTIVAGEEPDGIDIAPATDQGKPAVVIWGGNSDEPSVLPVQAIPAVIEALASAMRDALT